MWNTGKGGESLWGGSFDDEIDATLKHNQRGVLSMANKGANTNRSQFFFTYTAAPHLDNVYTVFGRIIHGIEQLDLFEKAAVDSKDRPINEIKITDVTIHANPFADSA